MTSLQATEITTDRARRTLCHHIEQWCEQGMSNVKVRINTRNEEPESAWFYGRVENGWKKESGNVEGSELAQLIQIELERLASSPHSKECQVRRKKFLDRIEFEIKFHHDKIVAHQGEQLGSYLFGVLFRERHAAPDSRRQGIRRGGMPKVARV